MTRLDVLDQIARQEFERQPAISPEQRQRFFALTLSLGPHLRGLDIAVKRVGFLLQWDGARVRLLRRLQPIFKLNTFAPANMVHVTKLLAIDPLSVKLGQFNRKTISRHRHMIRQELGMDDLRMNRANR